VRLGLGSGLVLELGLGLGLGMGLGIGLGLWVSDSTYAMCGAITKETHKCYPQIVVFAVFRLMLLTS